jgi:chemotaxis protein CheC
LTYSKTSASSAELLSWTKMARMGSTNAISGLSQMLNQELKVTALNLEEISIRNATGLVGKADDSVVAVYLLFSGNTTGHILLTFSPKTAFELVDMAMSVPPGSTKVLGEMERSVLGEIGNIAGTFFLNAVADFANSCLMPSPPVVVTDMAGAIMGSVVAEVLQNDKSAFAIRLTFGTSTKQIEGRFLVLPSGNTNVPATEHGEAKSK